MSAREDRLVWRHHGVNLLLTLENLNLFLYRRLDRPTFVFYYALANLKARSHTHISTSKSGITKII